MGEAVSLDFIGTTLRSIQAEQRTLRGENELIRKEIGRIAGVVASREGLHEVLRVLADRIGNFEALMEARFDPFFMRLTDRGRGLMRTPPPVERRPRPGQGGRRGFYGRVGGAQLRARTASRLAELISARMVAPSI